MPEHNLFAGAGKAEIRFPEEMFPTAEGYNKIHDAPHARMVILRSNGEAYAFAHLELNNIFETGTQRMLEAIRQETDIPEDHVFFHCLHVLETPHPEPPMKKGPEAERYNGLFYARWSRRSGKPAVMPGTAWSLPGWARITRSAPPVIPTAMS